MNQFEAWLEGSGAAIAVKQFPEGTRTAVDAARAIGCELGQIVKSLVFVASGRPVVALVSGTNRLDERRLSAVAGDPVLKADAQAARSATGYAIGGVPPFGHATEVPVFMDRDLLGYEVVWAAAGRPDSVFEIAPDRLRELSGATIADLKVIADSNPPPALRATSPASGEGARSTPPPALRATSPASGEGASFTPPPALRATSPASGEGDLPK